MAHKSRCHWHGGRNPGPPKGNDHALKHGRFSAAALAAKKEAAAAAAVREVVRRTKKQTKRKRKIKVAPDGTPT